ncbi:Snf7-domain-containing protein [Gilbertella persicaria]|uniref:Snf7-domain-containing protein n=1 Tax=Gilbertella persicaria TaxID=101096 RepID=UPI00221FBE71|nr:Snf7-domain-containing protein [Gilbertella persicaria]KAI8092203.1 Snf7-domain-containing protein [Gilbertella persicaria]
MGAGASKNKITSQDKAILDLKVQRDKLKRYQKNLNVVIDKEVEVAKLALQQGNKQKALLALKKKKYQVQLLEKTDQQLMNLEELTHSIEYALVEKQVLEGLQKGNDVLKEIHKETSIEAVEKLMDDTADAIAYQNEIDEMLHGLISAEEEEEIERELNELREEELNAKLPEVPKNKLPEPVSDPEIPSVPNHVPAPVKASAKEKQAMLAT